MMIKIVIIIIMIKMIMMIIIVIIADTLNYKSIDSNYIPSD